MFKPEAIIPEFAAEFRDLIPEIEKNLLALEAAPDPAEGDRLAALFRAVHWIRCGAGLTGLAKMEKLAQAMEEILDLVREGELELTGQVPSQLLQGLDLLALMTDQLETSDRLAIGGPLKGLTRLIEQGVEPEIRAALTDRRSLAKVGLPGLEISGHRLARKLNRGAIFAGRYDPAKVVADGVSIFGLLQELLALGEVMTIGFRDRSEGTEAGSEDGQEIRLLFFTGLDEETLRAGLNPLPETLTRVRRKDILVADQELKIENGSIRAELLPGDRTGSATRNPATGPDQAPLPDRTKDGTPGRKSDRAQPGEGAGSTGIDLATPGEYLTFFLGRDEYAVTTSNVQEIISLQPVTKLPNVPEFLIGVINLRGMVIPVVDLRLKLGFETREYDKFTVIIIVTVESKTTGLIVDTVAEVSDLTAVSIQAPPDFSKKVSSRFISGLGKIEDRFIVILSLEKLLTKEELT